jgi:ribosomal protein L37AE/L43A
MSYRTCTYCKCKSFIKIKQGLLICLKCSKYYIKRKYKRKYKKKYSLNEIESVFF